PSAPSGCRRYRTPKLSWAERDRAGAGSGRSELGGGGGLVGGDADREDALLVGLEHGDGEAADPEDLAHERDAVEGGEDEAGHRLEVALGQIPLERLGDLLDTGPAPHAGA